MKYLHYSLLISLLISFFLFGSCKKDSFSENSPTPSKTFSETTLSEEVHKNLLNPYDDIGQYHNDACDYIISTISGNPSLVNYTLDYGIIYNYYTLGVDIDYQVNLRDSFFHVTDSLMIAFDDDIIEVIHHAMDQWSYSISTKQYGHDLIDIISNNLDNPISTISPIICEIKNIETTFLNDTTLNAEEMAKLACISSTLRHSLYYWSVNPPPSLEPATNGWPRIIQAIIDFFADHEPEIIVGMADICFGVMAEVVSGSSSLNTGGATAAGVGAGFSVLAAIFAN